MAKLVKSLQKQNKISKNHRQHGSVIEKDHKMKVRVRLLLKEKIKDIERYENRKEEVLV